MQKENIKGFLLFLMNIIKYGSKTKDNNPLKLLKYPLYG